MHIDVQAAFEQSEAVIQPWYSVEPAIKWCQRDVVLAILKVSVEPLELLTLMKHGDRFKARVPHDLLVAVRRCGGLLDLISSPIALPFRAGDRVEVDIAIEQVLVPLDEGDILVEADRGA
jgi:hypothetical protein